MRAGKDPVHHGKGTLSTMGSHPWLPGGWGQGRGFLLSRSPAGLTPRALPGDPARSAQRACLVQAHCPVPFNPPQTPQALAPPGPRTDMSPSLGYRNTRGSWAETSVHKSCSPGPGLPWQCGVLVNCQGTWQCGVLFSQGEKMALALVLRGCQGLRQLPVGREWAQGRGGLGGGFAVALVTREPECWS